MEDEEAGVEEAASLEAIAAHAMGVVAGIQGRCPYDVVLKRLAVSDGKGVFYSEKEDELFAVLSPARDVIVHNLKPLILAAIRAGDRPRIPASSIPCSPSTSSTRRERIMASKAFSSEFLDVEIERGRTGSNRFAKSAFYLPRLKEELVKKA